MTLDNLISQLQDVRAVNGNIQVQLLEFYGAVQQKNKNSIFTNEIHLAYAEEEEEEETPPTEEVKTYPIGFC